MRVELPPAVIEAGLAFRVQTGAPTEAIVTVALATAPDPAVFVPVTVWVVIVVGVTVQVALVVPAHVPPLQV